MRFIRHLVYRSRRIAADEGLGAAVRYLVHPRERWRRWKQHA